MILAASIAEPPPTAITTSGLNNLICSAPFLAHASVGSGSTSENVECCIPIASSWSVTGLVYPFSYKNESVTINAFLKS